MEGIKRIFLNVDYDIKISYEKHYQSIFYLIFQLLGCRIQVEYKTDKGRIDAIMITKTNVYIFEFKVDKSAEEALQQIDNKMYYERFIPLNKPIYLIGVNFDNERRNIGEYLIKML